MGIDPSQIQKTSEKGKKGKFIESTNKRNMFLVPTDDNTNSFYMNLQPLHSAQYDGRTTGVCIPWWIPVLFRPPNELILDEIEASVAAYIFGLKYQELEHEFEILVTSRLGMFGERCRLRSLMPRQELHEDVLNLVVEMQTVNARSFSVYSICWFLPIDFSKYCFAWMKPPSSAMNYYKDDYMGKYEILSKVVYLEEMLQHDSFYEFNTTDKPRVTEFPLEIPMDVGTQVVGSNDCVVWVCKWMTDCTLSDNYNIKVDRGSRMRLAIDLVTKPYNIKKDTVVSEACAIWKKLQDERKTTK
ncbi:hypothetical protein SESBI_47542 [Sesbania bispinosa]|nr:hypothetical protein SESBI_47542 [Sesbania bispinosa]